LKTKKILKKCLWITAVVCAVAFIIYCVHHYLFYWYGSTDNFPNAEEVTSIEIGTLVTSNRDDINTIMSALSESRIISNKATSDHPIGENSLKLLFVRDIPGIAEVKGPLIYLYTDSGKERIWHTGTYILSISQDNSNMIRQLYYEMLN